MTLLQDLRYVHLWLMRWHFHLPWGLRLLWHWVHELHLGLGYWARHTVSRHSASSCVVTIANYRWTAALPRCKTICSVVLDHVVLEVLSCTVFCSTVLTSFSFTASVKFLMCSEHTSVVESLVAVVAIEPRGQPGPRQWWSSSAPPYSSPPRVCIAVWRVWRVPRVSSREL